ncbi:MAG: metallophosphoesterase family protein [Anaerolineaceae bacterium]
MTKVALFADIHANLPAYQACLRHAHALGARYAWNLGDFIGYGAFPNQVIESSIRHNVLSIAGNYDLKTFKVHKNPAQVKNPLKRLAFLWAYQQLTPQNRAYLLHLPKERRIIFKGWKILFTHGSPASNKEHLSPATPPERLKELSRLTKAKVILCGHSHQAFMQQVNDVLFINPGSVGRSDDGNPQASYAILNIKNQEIRVTHYRISYPISRCISEIDKYNLPHEFAEMVLQGRSLDQITLNE